MKIKICCLLAVMALLFVGVSTADETERFPVHGSVFLDRNGNGTRDKDENGLDKVYISNGIDFAATDPGGNCMIEVKPDILPLVYVIQPTGYRTTSPFFVHLRSRPETAHEVSFGLAPLAIPDVENKGLTFFHISDIHAPMFLGQEGLTKTLRPLMAKLVAELKQAGGQFILNTGDTVNEGAPKQWEDFSTSILPALTCPVWHVAGNHDFFGKKGEMEYTNLDSYHELLGPDYYSFNCLDNHFIVLDDCRNKDSALNQIQAEWLKKDLRLLAAGVKIFVINHTGSMMHLAGKEGAEVLRNHKITAMFHGHNHFARVRNVNGMMDIQAPIFNCADGLIDGMDWGYLKVNIKGDKISTEQHFIYDTEGVVPPTPDTDAGNVVTGTDWPMFQHDPAHSGYTGDRVMPPLKLKWRQELADNFNLSSPIVAGGRVIIGRPNEDIGRGGIIALDAATGKMVWKYATETAVRHTPCCADNKVFFATSGGETCAVNLLAGEKVWSNQGRMQGHSSYTVFNNTLFAAIDQKMKALDLETGKVNASSVTTEWTYSNFLSPAVNKDGLVFYGGVGLSLFCFDPSLKTVWHWERKDGKQPFPASHSSVVAAGDKIFWAANSALVALEAGSMKSLWTFPLGKGRIIYPTPVSTPCIDQNHIYVASEVDGKLYCLDQITGAKQWEYQTGNSLMAYGITDSRRPTIFSSPAISGTVIYLGAHDGYLHAVEAKTGRGLSKYFLGTPITSAPAISGNAVFVTGLNGTLYCLVGRKE